MITMSESNQWESQQNATSSLSTILNSKQMDTPMKDYLPTPVTPASDFPRLHNIDKDVKRETSSYSTFSVLKPVPQHNANRDSTTLQNSSSDSKPYPCPECHQTFSRPHNLKSHLTTHSSERPFQVTIYY
jgi:hypothetical protein